MTLLRPQLRLPFGTHPVLDASQTGIRVHHSMPVRPKLGSVLQGTLEFAHGEPPLQVSGIDTSTPGNTWNHVGVKLMARPKKSFVTLSIGSVPSMALR